MPDEPNLGDGVAVPPQRPPSVPAPSAPAASAPASSAPVPRKRAGFWGGQLDGDQDELTWLWRGYLAAAQVTLLTSQPKSGKTTLLSIILARLRKGGLLGDLPVSAGKAIVVSEESRLHWKPRHQRLDLGHVFFFCRPFDGKPTLGQWLDLLGEIAEMRRQEGFALLAVDTLASFLPGGNESNPDTVMKALLPLSRLTQDGMNVLLSHHPRKGIVLPGQAARGSGAFAGFADIIIEMARCPAAAEHDRRRRLLAFSRSDVTPRQLVLELNFEATDYIAHGDFLADDFMDNWQRLRVVLEDASDKRTRRQILTEWPADFPRPCDATLWSWLSRATGLGLICQEGTGRRNEPFRYWLPAKMAQWRDDPMWVLERQIEEDRKNLLESLGGAPGGPH